MLAALRCPGLPNGCGWGQRRPYRTFFIGGAAGERKAVRELGTLIPNRVQDETNSLVLWPAGFVARSLQIAADMRLARASRAGQNPARLSLILNAHWNKN